MTSAKRAALGALTLGAVALARASAQNPPVPPPAQAQQALQQAVQQRPELADVLRQRIQGSGLTPDQVRSRLAASGYPPNLLDPYLGATPPGQASSQPGAQELAAIQVLGFGAVVARVESLPVDTGLIHTRADSTITHIFGADVFRRSTTQFLPLLAGPVPTDYKLGPGDVLVLILTGDVELAYTLPVTREGFVLIQQVGQVFVSNLTLDQLRDVLYTRLGRVYSGVKRGPNATTRFDITVANVRANQVYVVGEVKQPGAYQISALGTALSALYAAGGVTERSNMRQIDIRRLGHSVATLDLYDYLLHGDTRSDIRLETGDVVFVPVHGTRTEIGGAVVRPAIYELKPGESLQDLIRAAGGFRPNAALNRVSVHRILPAALRTAGVPARTVIDVQLAPEQPDPPGDPPGADPPAINGVILPSFGMNDGDSVVVDSLPAKAGRNFVDIRGSVYQPGRYGLEPGMALSRLVKRAGGFRPATYAGRAHIERLNLADSTRYVVAVELPGDTGGSWKDDPKLQQYDVVTVYGRPEMRDSLYVAIAGMVNVPGRYVWRQGITLRDVILMAHGPRVGAYLKEAEVARLPTDRSAGQLAQTLRVALDSTYLFDRDSSGGYVGPPGLPAPARGAPEVALEPYDNVLILKQPDFELQRRVYVLGEVRFPGTYSLKSKDERLADVIERAGGLTTQAYSAGIRFVRVVGNAGRINIDLTRALEERRSRADIILQQGDSILVPEYQPSVKVAGAVNAPGSVLWQEGQGLDDYIGGAGGYSYLADHGRVSVRYANGEVRTRRRSLLFSSEPRPGPGSEVFVPVKDTTHTTNYVALFGSIAQILASTIAIIVVIRRP
jgi:protein involved in polysaccharide export with SLBB domain